MSWEQLVIESLNRGSLHQPNPANAKEIVDAADKYEVVGLKLEAEASLVAPTTFTMENVMDNLLYADSNNCALLKEAVMDFLVKNVEQSHRNTQPQQPNQQSREELRRSHHR